MNEVIFHDPVPMEYCCMEIDRSGLSCLLEPGNDFLPDYPIDNHIQPNKNLLPFYCCKREKKMLPLIQIYVVNCLNQNFNKYLKQNIN